MTQYINEPISVVATYNHARKTFFPSKVYYGGQCHEIIRVGFHHKSIKGRTLYHVFSVISKNMFFKLTLNTENLIWHLEEISDGTAN